MDLAKYVIGFVIFGLFVFSGFLLMGDMNTNYGTNLSDEDFGDTFENISSDMYDTSYDMKEKTLGEEIEDENILETIVKGAFRAIKQVKNTFSIFIMVSQKIGDVLRLPTFFVAAAITIMLITVVFALIYLFMRISST